MCFATEDTLKAPTLKTEEIVVSGELRLRTMPELFDALRTALAFGAERIEIDTKAVSRITQGAECMLSLATRRLEERGVEVVFHGGADQTMVA